MHLYNYTPTEILIEREAQRLANKLGINKNTFENKNIRCLYEPADGKIHLYAKHHDKSADTAFTQEDLKMSFDDLSEKNDITYYIKNSYKRFVVHTQ